MVRLLLSSILPLHLPLFCMSSNFYWFIFFCNFRVIFFPHGPPAFQFDVIIFLISYSFLVFVYPYVLDSYFSNTASLTRVPTCQTLEDGGISILLHSLVIEAHLYIRTNRIRTFLTGGVFFNLQFTKPCLSSPTSLMIVAVSLCCVRLEYNLFTA